jgi:hypothetical protein
MSKTIDQLDPAAALAGTEAIHIVQNGKSVRVTLAALAQHIKVAQTIVPASEPFRGALLRRTSNLTSVSFPAFIPWQQAAYDSDSFWSAGAATRITIPAGVTKVRITGSARLNPAAEAGGLSCRVWRNGSEFEFSASIVQRQGEIGFTDNALATFTPVVPVVAGDYFELRVNKDVMASVTSVLSSNTATFFSVEVIERD